jgi:hypothetical protein
VCVCVCVCVFDYVNAYNIMTKKIDDDEIEWFIFVDCIKLDLLTVRIT